MRNICDRVGGRFKQDESGKVTYDGGYTRYIHHVDAEEFKFGELFYAVYKIHLRTPEPKRAWYLRYDETIPEGLRPIENDDSIEMMSFNVEETSRLVVEVYMQDCDHTSRSRSIPPNC